VRVVRDARVNLGKGIAYVLFANVASMPAALALHESEFQDRVLRVSKAEPEARRKRGMFKKEVAANPKIATNSSSVALKRASERMQKSSSGVDRVKAAQAFTKLDAAIAKGQGQEAPERKKRKKPTKKFVKRF
jgi:RNA recognition motif-containing protein